MYDVIIIGGGVVGAAVARELSRYCLNVALLEKEEDVCSGTSKANSAIIHAGFDAQYGSLKAQMNVRGNEMMDELSKNLEIDFVRNGALVVCTEETDIPKLQELYERGVKNGVKNLQILNKEQLREAEANLSANAVAALYAPTSGIVCPFEMTVALAENAADNGVEFFFNQKVTGIKKAKDVYKIFTETDSFEATYVVNAAGLYADEIHNMVSEKKLKILPRAGEYNILDREVGDYVRKTIFRLPDENSKGVLVAPTVHGNLLIGPTATFVESKENTSTTAGGLSAVMEKSKLCVSGIPYQKVITSFTGLRAHEQGNDFVIGEADDADGFFDAAGIESPGLSSAPAIGEYIAELIAKKAKAKRNKDFIETRKGIPHIARLSFSEKAKLISSRPEYGTIVCRCEDVTEGEIMDAIHRTLGARTLDGIKRRVRQGMGRCQAGFCLNRTMEILSRETGIPMEEIRKNGKGSEILKGKVDAE